MDESLRKKILYAVCIGIVVLCGIIALLFLLRKPQKEKVITRTEYMQQQSLPQQTQSADLKAFLPPLTQGSASATPLVDRTNPTTSNDTTTDETTSNANTPPTTTTTESVSKAWDFFKQSIGLPWVLVTSVFPNTSSCGGAHQQVCPQTPNNVTIVTEETHITHITMIQQVVEIPLSLMDSLQDIVFYKFITLLQQSAIASETYPVQSKPEATDWLLNLIQTGEMSQFYYDVFKSTNAQARLCGTPLQEGFCYESNGKSANLYIRLRAGTTQCPRGAIKTWNSDKNALQVTCFSENTN